RKAEGGIDKPLHRINSVFAICSRAVAREKEANIIHGFELRFARRPKAAASALFHPPRLGGQVRWLHRRQSRVQGWLVACSIRIKRQRLVLAYQRTTARIQP